MSARAWLVMLVVVMVGWWYSPLSPRTPSAPVHLDATAADICRMPPRVRRGGEPLQTDVPRGVAGFRVESATLKPLAGFSIDARVLSREDYRFGREAGFSPTDLALGWSRMREEAVIARLEISQSGRWYRYRWQGEPPLPLDEIIRSSANMHMIPANDLVAAELDRIKPGDNVRIDGWLVRIDGDEGWHWQSSLRRDDSGGGACELVYACSITRE